MHNDLIKSKSNLSLSETKLLRLIIMQAVKEDADFKTYCISIKKLADLLNINFNGLYGKIFNICDNLMKEVVYIGGENQKHDWKIFHWCSSCEYKNGMITIRLHDDLKPYLLELSNLYTQYVLENILLLKSTFSIRIYELLMQEIKYKKACAEDEADVYLSVDLIRRATDTENKYKDSYNMFEKRVVRSAVNEINEKLDCRITYDREKESRKVAGFIFHITKTAVNT